MEQSSLRARRPVPGMRWWMLVLLSAFMVLNYSDRAALSVSAPFIMRSLDVDLASFGTVLSIFLGVIGALLPFAMERARMQAAVVS